MKDLIDALGPWPALQGIIIGLMVAGVGIWALRKGFLADPESAKDKDDGRDQWEAYRQLSNIEQNSWHIRTALEKLAETAKDVEAAILNLSRNKRD